MTSIGEGFLHVGHLLVPILLWVAVFQLMRFYIDESSMNMSARVYILWALLLTCLTFLMLWWRAGRVHKCC